MSKEIKILKLIKNAEVYSPQYLGKKDVLIASEKIVCVKDNIQVSTDVEIEIIDAEGKLLVPGFIDAHVHILGGGGEGSFKTRTPEINLTDITTAGVTTVVGCLGTDAVTRTLTNLVAKARGLQEEGITCYMYTGSYQLPLRTITGSVRDDIVLIDKVIGVGEVAISDHRSSQPTTQQMAEVSGEARVGGMLSGKAGIVHLHLGHGKRKLQILEELVKTTEIPISQFVPTHLSKNPDLFASAIEHGKRGGYVDLTTSAVPDSKAIKCSKGLKLMLEKGVSIDNISFSSDAQGSLPIFDENGNYVGLDVGSMSTLFEEVVDAVKDEGIPFEDAIKVITTTPARALKLKEKGHIVANSDADIVLLNKSLEIDTVIARGQTMIKEKEILVKGTFE